MGKLITMIAGAVLVAVTPAAAATPEENEAELERALEGRVAGEPVSCIDLHRVRSSRVINDTAILYDAGSTLYLQRPRSGASSLNRWDTLVTRSYSTRLCSIDTVNIVDTQSGMLTGVVFLDEFVPYRRVSRASAD
ncbi:MAG: hypothetical protein ACXWU1_12570 [Allosphingosinicella sp.]